MLQAELGGSVRDENFDSPVCALKIRRIVLPVDFPGASPGLLHQAATLARHFHSEVVMLRVMTARNEIGAHDDPSLGPEFSGLTVQSTLVEGDPVRALLQLAQAKTVDLIMMSSHGVAFSQFLLHPGITQVHDCPIWISPRVEQVPMREFVIRNILCAVDFDSHSHTALLWAAQMAAGFGARLTLAHVSPSLKCWGPGGSYADPEREKAVDGDASRHLEKARRDMGIDAGIFIGSGDMSKVLSQAVKQTNADVLVNACYPFCGNLGLHGFSIISALPIPVLSV